MPFYYRTKTGIPGLYYRSSYRRSNGDIVVIVFTLFVTFVAVILWLYWLMLKWTFILVYRGFRLCYKYWQKRKKLKGNFPQKVFDN